VHAAEHRHQQRVAGMLPAQIVGVGAVQHQGEHGAGKSDDASHDHEGLELDAPGVVAEAAHAQFVVAQRLQHPAKRGMRNAPQQRHAATHCGDGEDVKRPIIREQRSRHALKPVFSPRQGGPLVGDLEGDLGKGQSQQREIKPTAAQDDQRDNRGQDQREQDGENQRLDLVRQPAEQRYGRRVARAAEEHRRAERHQTGIADQ
jgi:hypothetical protein